jgi:hypothetical protein
MLRPDPNSGCTQTPPTKGVSNASRTTSPISSSFTPSEAHITSVVNTSAAESRATTLRFVSRRSAER